MDGRVLKRVFDLCLNALAQVGLALMVVTVFSQVVFRYVVHRPLMWSEELTKMTYLWLTFIGSTIATRDGAHISVDFFVQKASRKTASPLKRFIVMVNTVFCLLIAYQAWMYAKTQAGIRSVALDIPLAWTTTGIVVGMTLMGIYHAILLIDDVARQRGSNR